MAHRSACSHEKFCGVFLSFSFDEREIAVGQGISSLLSSLCVCGFCANVAHAMQAAMSRTASKPDDGDGDDAANAFSKPSGTITA